MQKKKNPRVYNMNITWNMNRAALVWCYCVCAHSRWFSLDSAAGGGAGSLTERWTCLAAAPPPWSSVTHKHKEWELYILLRRDTAEMLEVCGRLLSLYLIWKVHLVRKLLQSETRRQEQNRQGSFTSVHGSALRTDRSGPHSSRWDTGRIPILTLIPSL